MPPAIRAKEYPRCASIACGAGDQLCQNHLFLGQLIIAFSPTKNEPFVASWTESFLGRSVGSLRQPVPSGPPRLSGPTLHKQHPGRNALDTIETMLESHINQAAAAEAALRAISR
jgi:hypothetical protein